MTERPNIRRMQMPEHSGHALPFDAEKEITGKDWEKIIQSWKREHVPGRTDPVDLAWLGKSILLLDPKRDVAVSEEINRKVISRLEDANLATGDPSVIDAYIFNFLRMVGEPYSMSPALVSADVELIQSSMSISCDEDLAELVVCLYAENPSHITEKHIEWLQSSLQSWRNGAVDLEENDAIGIAVTLRCIGRPARLSREDWREWKKYLNACRADENAHHFAYLAACLKILAADEVKMTEKGIELVTHKPNVKEEMVQMPNSLEI